MRRIGIVSSLALAAAVFGATAQAARLTDVRVGRHPGYTRVVLELDEPADYRLRAEELPREGGSVTELVLELEAAGAFAIARPEGLVESIRVKPRGSGSEARIRLSTSGAGVEEMVLGDPPRIVLDLRPGAEATGAPAPGATQGAPGEGEAEADRAGTAGGEAPAPAPAVAAGREGARAEAEPSAPEPAPAPEGAEAPRAEAESPPGERSAPEEPEPAEELAAEASEAAEADKEMASTPRPGSPAPEAEQGRPARPSPPAPEARERPSASRERPRAGRSAGEPTRPAPSTSWSRALGDSRLVWMILLVVALFVAWGLLRRRARSHAEARDLPPVPPPEPPLEPTGEESEPAAMVSERDVVPPEQKSAGGAEEPARPSEPGAHGKAGAPPGPEAPSAAPEEPELPSMPHAGSPPSAAAAPSPPPSPSAGAPGAEARAVEELERRLHVLESRVEELVDARERVERQLSAHTEELRVQRSAIARAQRVLRTLTRPEEPTEPAPRGPSRNPGA